jgi:hypothetical protein
VFAAAAAVGEEVDVVATGIFEGVGEDRQVGKVPAAIDAASEGQDTGREPAVIYVYWPQ